MDTTWNYMSNFVFNHFLRFSISWLFRREREQKTKAWKKVFEKSNDAKLRRYQSINDIDIGRNNAPSLENINRALSTKKSSIRNSDVYLNLNTQSPKSSSPEIDEANSYKKINKNYHTNISPGYSIPIIREYKKPYQTPIVVKKPYSNVPMEEIFYDSTGRVVHLPVNRQRSASTVPFNLNQYPLNELDSNIIERQSVNNHHYINAHANSRSSQRPKTASFGEPVYIYEKSQQKVLNQDKFEDESNEQKYKFFNGKFFCCVW